MSDSEDDLTPYDYDARLSKLPAFVSERALESFRRRRAERSMKIDNAQLPAGSPMYFFCTHCGWLSDVVPEDYLLGKPRKVCTECQFLIDSGLHLLDEPDPDFFCPVCGGREFLEGPHGGLAVNFACKECWARYNDLWPFHIERHGWVADDEREAFSGKYVPRKPYER